MDEGLYGCALKGDVGRLRELILKDDPILLEANPKGNNILHIAAIYGHPEFAREVLNAKPELSSELNEAGYSPLHLAAAKGHVDIVNVLLSADPDLSFIKDKHGRLPAHMAAMEGRVDVLRVIASVNPWCLQEVTDKGETILHLGVKGDRMQVVDFLKSENKLNDMINKGDCRDNTALHLAAARNQEELIRFLMNDGTADVKAKNKYGVTACDLIRRWRQNDNDDMVLCKHHL